MRVTLHFLGRLMDVAGGAMLALDLPASARLGDALVQLPAALAQALANPRVKCAHNGVLVAGDAALALADGDELAFLPPVSGG